MGDSISICNTVNIFTVINVICILRWWSGCIYEDKCHIFGKTWVTQDCQTMECKGNKWSFRNGILRKGGFSNSDFRKPTNLLNVCLRMWILLSKVLKFCCQVYFIFTHIAKLKIKTKLLGSMRFFLRYGAFNMTSLHCKCVLHINYYCIFF